MPIDRPDELQAFIEAVERALTEQFGPDHQAILSRAGPLVSAFEW